MIIKKISQYNKTKIKDAINEYFLQKSIEIRNEKILIKPNLIAPKSIDKSVNTHPIVVEALSEYLLDFNNNLFIGDSPGVGTLHLNLKVSGYSNLIKDKILKIYPFDKKIVVKRENNKILKKFKIVDAIENFDKIFNVAKLKTHCMTGMTLSVKNCYGFIAGKDKIGYHFKAGNKLKYFANILIDIYETVNPFINIVDGIYGMEGNGPTSGISKNFGIFGISQNGYKLDRCIEKITGFPGKTIVSAEAEKRGFFTENEINVSFPIKIKIKPAKTKSASFLPSFISNLISPKPVINDNLCKKCMQCYESCPPQAIEKVDGKLKINYSKCIKCFCCHELCMFNAVKLKRLFL